MDVRVSEKYRLTILLTIIGGFLEAYTFLTRDGVFANAQTGNIARMGLAIANGDLHLALRYVVPPVFFVLGVSLSMQFRSYCIQRPSVRLCWRQITLLAEIILLFIIGFIPAGAPNMLVTVAVSFVCALQVESFRKFNGNVFASTMCTGNLRSATENLNYYFDTGDRSYLCTSLMYFGIDLIFVCGVIIGFLATKWLECRAVWLCLVFLAAALFMVSFQKDAG